MKLRVTLLACVLSCLSIAPASADLVDPTNFSETTWLNTVDQITGMAWAPDGSNRLFLSRKTGTVRIVQMGANGAGTLLATPFLTLAVHTVNECGLDGIAFDPDFVHNGYVYVFATISAGEQRVIRYTATGDIGGSPTPIITGLATSGQNHNGGGLGFGADGKLYWAIGDNGNGTGVDNDLASSAAKVSRANRDGTVAADNPFIDGTGPNYDYIFARGFRNPFTLTFQPTTGLLWVNVVGTGFEQIFVVRSGDHAGYDNYENNQPTGFITPVIAYKTGNPARTVDITSVQRAGGTVTFTTTTGHRLRQGERIDVTGVANASFNARYYVAQGSDAPNDTTFTALQAGADASSTGGTITLFAQGNALAGGTFYDATAFPAQYVGNFFYGDYGASNFMRAVVDVGATTVRSVDLWSTNLAAPIDTSVGPDGALYTVSYGGAVRRTVYTGGSQTIVVSNSNVRTIEGGGIAFSVSLLKMPAGNVTVTTSHTAGDSDVSVTTGASLTFTTTNWMVPQPVRIDAAADTDTVNDVATLTVASAGLASQSVHVDVLDEQVVGITLSRTSIPMLEGGTETFSVALSNPPGTATTVNVSRSAGDADVSVTGGATLTFTPGNFATPQTVTITAAEDPDNTDDAATISVSSAGLTTRTVSVTVQDNEERAPVITSTADTTAVVASQYTYDVEGNGFPVPTYALTVAPPGMTIDATTGVISWTPPNTGTFDVTVTASNGVVPNATQSFALEVVEDQPPTASITQPIEGSTVSGTMGEFYGDGMDDVGAVRAEFYIDGDLAFTDPGSMGHFHINGTHQLWDTTILRDGPHVVRMVVYDEKNQSGFAERNVIVDNGKGGADAGGGGGLPDGGCGCRTASRTGTGAKSGLGFAMLALVFAARRRKR